MRAKPIFRASATALLAGGWLLTGCATTTSSSTEVTNNGPSVNDEASEEVRQHHRHHHHGGLTMFIAMSLDSLGLPSEKQPQAEQIEAELAAALAPARNAEHDLINTLAAGVAAGAIDTAKVDAAVAQVGIAAAGVHAAAVAPVNQLHALLSPEERTELVNKVRAHWAVWRKVNCDEKSSSGSHLDRLTEQLHLSAEQLSQIQASLEGSEDSSRCKNIDAVQPALDTFAQTFVTETFDYASVTSENTANGGIATAGATRMAHFYEAVTPALTPDQRSTLAGQLHARTESPAPAEGSAP